MQEFGQQHTALFVIALIALVIILWLAIGIAISFLTGWHSLAERYRTEREFSAHKCLMQNAQMRWGGHYNGILTFASDAEGIYMGLTIRLFPGHPKLLVPWSEIQMEEPKRWFFFMMRRLRLGPDGIPVRIREPLAQFLLEPRGGTNAAATGAISSTFCRHKSEPHFAQD